MKTAFEAIASANAARLAISDDKESATFSDLSRRAKAIHEQALAARTVVLVALPGGVAFTTVQLACFRAEAVFVPIPHESTLREARAFVESITPDVIFVESLEAQASVLEACADSGAAIVTLEKSAEGAGGPVVVTFGDLVAARRELPRRATSPFPAETRTVQFTSGSTGKPKGILIAETSWRATLEQNGRHLSVFSGKHVFCPLPQFHAMGNAVVVEHLFHGSPIHISNDFNPGAHLKRLTEHGCTAILASPNYFKLMGRLGVISAETLPDLKSITIGTAAIDESLVKNLRQSFPDIDIHCRYGLSESVGCMVRLTLPAGAQLPQKGLIGRPVPGVELEPGLPTDVTKEPGELRVKSAANAIGIVVAKGSYVPLADERGYLATGDLAHLTADGHLLVRGRLSSFLKSNGYRINPFEIEDVLRAVPNVQEAVVVGVPDPASGQRIVACLEPSPGATIASTPELVKICEGELSAHKVPQGFLTLSPFPRTPAGKPDRTRILAAATEWVAASAASTTAASGQGVAERVMAIVKRAISENVGHEVSFSSDHNLVLAGYLDSLTLVTLVVALQEEFETTIPVTNLTPEQFASVDIIVEYLQKKDEDGSVFETPREALRRRTARPSLSLGLTAAMSVALVASFARAPSDDRGSISNREWHRVKAACRGCADVVIAGSSQASVNFSPQAVSQALSGMAVHNLGFSTQPYSDHYLDMIGNALKPSGVRAVLLVITPISLVPRAKDDEAEYASTLVGKHSRVRDFLDDVRDRFHSRGPCELLLGACAQHRYLWRLPDGWAPETIVGFDSPTAGAERMTSFMRRWSAVLSYDVAGYQNLLDRIRAWTAQGIHVIALRAPVPPEMEEAEAALPSYDETAMKRNLSDAGVTWIAVDGKRYDAFDGWHMGRETATRFSGDVGSRIAELLSRAGGR